MLSLVKSMHILHFLLLFLTSTGLANHCIWMTSRITLASSNFHTSSCMTSFLSADIFRTFSLCVFFLGSMWRWFLMNYRLTPCRSDGLQANTFSYFHRRVRRALSSSKGSLSVTKTVRSGTPPVVPLPWHPLWGVSSGHIKWWWEWSLSANQDIMSSPPSALSPPPPISIKQDTFWSPKTLMIP
jgi:hypothetical protein